jgi:hypothetical protein
MAPNNDLDSDTQQDANLWKSLFQILHSTRSLAGQVTFGVFILGTVVLTGINPSLLALPALAGISSIGLNLLSNLIQDVATGKKDEEEIKAIVLTAIQESHLIEVLDHPESQIALARLVREQRHLRYAVQFGFEGVADRLTEQYKVYEAFREELLNVAIDIKEGQQELISGQGETLSILHDIRDFVQTRRETETIHQTTGRRHDFYRHIRLPENFIPREEIVENIADRLLGSYALSSGSKAESMVLHGMGGLGKSVLARALCDERRIQERFVDGILWVTLGQQPNIRMKLIELIISLGSATGNSENSEDLLVEKLVMLLEDRACLLVIDDAWDAEVVSKFLVGGKKCRHIITTRNSIIARKINAYAVKLSEFSEDEALDLLTHWAGSTRQDINVQLNRKIVKKLKFLPLAIKLAGARLQDIGPEKWLSEFDRLSDLDFGYKPKFPQESLVVCFKLSLTGLTDNLQKLFLSLAIFPPDTLIPMNPIFVLWNEAEGIRSGDVEKIVSELHSNALLEAVSDARGIHTVYMHDLVHMFAKEYLDQKYLESLRLLLSGYRKQQSGSGWHTVIDDGYLFDHLISHLLETDDMEDALALFNDQGWFNARLAHNGYSYAAYIGDIDLVLEKLQEQNLERSRHGHKLERTALFMKLVAIKTSLNSVAANYPPEFIARAYELGVWSPERTLSVIKQTPKVARKFRACVLLMNMKKLAPALRVELQQTAIALLDLLDEHSTYRKLSRPQAIDMLLPLLSAEHPESIMESIFRLTQRQDQLSVLQNAFPLLPADIQQLIVSRIQAVQSKLDRCRLLKAVDPALLRAVDFSEEVALILGESDEELATQTIREVAPYLNRDQAEQIYYRMQSFTDRDAYFQVLSSIGPFLENVDFTSDLAEIEAHALSFPRVQMLSSIMTHIDERQRESILSSLVNEFIVLPFAHSVEFYPDFLGRFGLYLSDALVEQIFNSVLEKKSGWLYSFTLEYLGNRITPAKFRQLLIETINGPEYAISRALRAVRDLLDHDLRKFVIKEVLELKDERSRFECILEILPILPEEDEDLVLAAFEDLQDRSLGIEGFAAMLPKLDNKRRAEVLGRAIDLSLSLTGPQMEQSLISLIPYLDPPLFFKVQNHLVLVMDDLFGYIRAESALLRMGHMQGHPISSEMLVMAQSLEEEEPKALALQALAPILDANLLPQAIKSACEIKEELYRLQTFDHYLSRLEMNELGIILNNILEHCSVDRKAEFLPHLAKLLVGEHKRSAIECASAAFDEMSDVGLIGPSAAAISQHYQGQEKTLFLMRALNKIRGQEQDLSQVFALSHLACAMDGQDRADLVSQLVEYIKQHVTTLRPTDCLEILLPILSEDELRGIREIVMSSRRGWGKSELLILLLPRDDESARNESIEEVLEIARKYHGAKVLRHKNMYQLINSVPAEQRDRLLDQGIQAARELPDHPQQLMALFAYTKVVPDSAPLVREIQQLFIKQLLQLGNSSRSDFLKFCALVSPLLGKAVSEAVSQQLRDVYTDWKW